MDRVRQLLWRGVEEPVLSVAEGTSAGLHLPHAARSFSTTGASSVFPCSRERTEVPLTIQVRISAESCCRVSVVEKLRAAWVN
jgi:hypothetical protein